MHLQCGRLGFDPWVGKISKGRQRIPPPVFWPGEFYGLYTPWSLKESDTTEWHSLLLSLPAKWSEVKVAQSCLTPCNPMNYTVHEFSKPEYWSGLPFPFSRGSSQPRDRTQVSCTAGAFFTSWATREASYLLLIIVKWVNRFLHYGKCIVNVNDCYGYNDCHRQH